MAVEHQKTLQVVWALLLTVMGLVLCVKTPYVIRETGDSGFLNFTRYFIGALLVIGGVRKLYGLYGTKREDIPPEE